MLEVKNIGISFGGLKAVDNFSLTIEKGQLYGLSLIHISEPTRRS